MSNFYRVYWVRNGKEFERFMREEDLKNWESWAKKNAASYGKEKI